MTTSHSETKANPELFTVYQDKKDKWRWRLLSPNGRIIGASSQGYVDRADCLGNVKQLSYELQGLDI